MTAGTYGGGTFGSKWGVGGGAYIDNRGRLYPQFYVGTPRLGLSAGYTSDLEGLLTGPSASGGVGFGPVRGNIGTSGGATGVGFGTPGYGITYGFGPYELSDDYSQPWKRPLIRDSAAAAGIPTRSNVWEYDYPDASTGRSTSFDAAGASAPVRSPREIADFLARFFVSPQPDGVGRTSTFVRDSAAGAGVPSRNNVFEYGYPEPASGSPPLNEAPAHGGVHPGASGGLLGQIAALGDNARNREWSAPAIEPRRPGEVFSEGAPPVRFLDRVSGPLQRDLGDPRISDPSSYDLNDLLQDYVRSSFVRR